MKEGFLNFSSSFTFQGVKPKPQSAAEPKLSNMIVILGGEVFSPAPLGKKVSYPAFSFHFLSFSFSFHIDSIFLLFTTLRI